ncbi:Deoxynucleotidyltransferase terminal-interacting protein 2 [Tetrabaena socialis]|uniref:Deoxynucleotidyltransferase terminal-interacting protein 2 n=1 Tax=Tetrabaena socialis TaxID=47790 RepID=A0A2J7ZT86_9CHLO|nr:Deoxynucleotidyltransferase terminal-interacting protein 2 [Tetrabaena socialis]|eukprot:PNH03485.1 Deoxynucleotidyltransferase terminal-interacting protein 2 [Tetrabaena socialis]
MVATRRSGQKPEPQDASQEGSGPSTSSQPARTGAGGRGARGRPRAAAAAQEQDIHPLQPIEEHTAHGHAEQQGQEDAQTSARPLQAEQEPRASNGAFGAERRASQINAADSTDDDDDSDDDIVGPNLMDQLALSLRAALQARSGAREASPPPGAAKQLQREPEQKLGLSSNPDHIQWQPDLQRVKELVPAHQRVAPGTGGDKESGLAKQLLAPPRCKDSDAAGGGKAKPRWHQLPATKITPEIKQELRLLRLRGAYDPKRFYKSFDETKFPKHFQIGTVLDNPQDYYSSRLASRERGASITQELLADPAVGRSRKKRYARLQTDATKYQKVKKRKTDLKRAAPKPKRPKH